MIFSTEELLTFCRFAVYFNMHSWLLVSYKDILIPSYGFWSMLSPDVNDFTENVILKEFKPVNYQIPTVPCAIWPLPV